METRPQPPIAPGRYIGTVMEIVMSDTSNLSDLVSAARASWISLRGERGAPIGSRGRAG